MDNSLFDNHINPVSTNLYPVIRQDELLGSTELDLKFEKEKIKNNIKLHDRNFGNANNYILDGRSCATSLCTSGKFCDSGGWPEIFTPTIKQCDNYFIPQGRGEPQKYAQNIDVESRVHNMDYKINKCGNKTYKDGVKCDENDDNVS